MKSKDPGYCGFIRKYPHEQKNNVNRELVSCRAGAEACSMKYCIVMRSDMMLTGADFLDIYNRVSKYVTTQSVVSRRIMVEALSTSKSGVTNFGISNWWYMGLTLGYSPFILCVGDSQSDRNLSRLINAYIMYKERWDTNIKLVIVGKSSLYDDMYDEIEEYEDEILFTGCSNIIYTS